MAIYYFDGGIIGRSSGRSAVGASAYRAGEKLRSHAAGSAAYRAGEKLRSHAAGSAAYRAGEKLRSHAAGSAAYRAGEKLRDELEVISDYYFEKAIEKLPTHQVQLLTNIREQAKEREALLRFEREQAFLIRYYQTQDKDERKRLLRDEDERRNQAYERGR